MMAPILAMIVLVLAACMSAVMAAWNLKRHDMTWVALHGFNLSANVVVLVYLLGVI